MLNTKKDFISLLYKLTYRQLCQLILQRNEIFYIFLIILTIIVSACIILLFKCLCTARVAIYVIYLQFGCQLSHFLNTFTRDTNFSAKLKSVFSTSILQSLFFSLTKLLYSCGTSCHLLSYRKFRNFHILNVQCEKFSCSTVLFISKTLRQRTLLYFRDESIS